MPFQLQPTQYQSTFAPADLGVVQHGLEGRQQRYDTANSAWQQSKAQLYDDPSYDPNAKQEVVKAIEGNFENVYKSYNGDMGAAVNDLTNMIANSRKNPYFNLNKTALEEQKKYEALKQAYGAKGLEFKGMKQGLKDEKGNWRKPEDFKAEVVQDLERDKTLAGIIEQSLEQVSREGRLHGSGIEGVLEGVTEYGKGLHQDYKRKGILEEYKKTPEGQLHMRMLKELPGYKSDNPDQALEDYVNAAITNRIAPASISRQYQNLPKDTEGSGSKTPPEADIYGIEQTTTKTGGTKLFSSGSDIIKSAGANETTPKKDIAYNKVKTATSHPEMIRLRNEIREGLKKNGLNESEHIKVGFIKIPVNKYQTGRGEKTEIVPLDSQLQEKISLYNKRLEKTLDEQANANDYKDANWTHVDRNKAYRMGGKPYETYADETMKNTVNEVSRIGLDGFIFEDSPYANKKEYDDDDYKSFSDVKDAQFAFDTKSGMFAIKVKTSDGKSHIAIPKSLESATSLARAYGHPQAIAAAVISNIDFIDGSPRFYKKVDGVPKAYSLPENVTVSQRADGKYLISNAANGRTIIAEDKYTVADQLNLID